MMYVLFRILAELEYLEVDQYIWGILTDATTANSTEIIVEVSPDQISASVAADQCQQQQNGCHFILLFISAYYHCSSLQSAPLLLIFWQYTFSVYF